MNMAFWLTNSRMYEPMELHWRRSLLDIEWRTWRKASVLQENSRIELTRPESFVFCVLQTKWEGKSVSGDWSGYCFVSDDQILTSLLQSLQHASSTFGTNENNRRKSLSTFIFFLERLEWILSLLSGHEKYAQAGKLTKNNKGDNDAMCVTIVRHLKITFLSRRRWCDVDFNFFRKMTKVNSSQHNIQKDKKARERRTTERMEGLFLVKWTLSIFILSLDLQNPLYYLTYEKEDM